VDLQSGIAEEKTVHK